MYIYMYITYTCTHTYTHTCTCTKIHIHAVHDDAVSPAVHVDGLGSGDAASGISRGL